MSTVSPDRELPRHSVRIDLVALPEALKTEPDWIMEGAGLARAFSNAGFSTPYARLAMVRDILADQCSIPPSSFKDLSEEERKVLTSAINTPKARIEMRKIYAAHLADWNGMKGKGDKPQWWRNRE